MATSSAQKLKVLHLMDILRTETDPEHGPIMPRIVKHLAERGIGAERRGLHHGIETLREFGMDVHLLKRRPIQHVMCDRDFERSREVGPTASVDGRAQDVE